MQLAISDPKTKEKMVLTEFEAELEDNFSRALGRIPGDRWRSCDDDEDASKIWPIHFNLTTTGTIETEKEGRLRVKISAKYSMEKGKTPENKNGFRIKLTRESTGADLGGFLTHDHISAMVRVHADRLVAPAKAALLAKITKLRKSEDLASAAHASRSRIAGLVVQEFKAS